MQKSSDVTNEKEVVNKEIDSKRQKIDTSIEKNAATRTEDNKENQTSN